MDYSVSILTIILSLQGVLGYHLTLSAGSLFDTLSTAIENGLNYAGVLNIKRNAPMPKFITVKGIKLPVIGRGLDRLENRGL